MCCYGLCLPSSSLYNGGLVFTSSSLLYVMEGALVLSFPALPHVVEGPGFHYAGCEDPVTSYCHWGQGLRGDT